MEEWRQMSLQAGAAAGQIRRQNMQSTCTKCRKENALRRGRPLGRLRPLCFCMLPKKMGQLNDDLGEGGRGEGVRGKRGPKTALQHKHPPKLAQRDEINGAP